jgi:hypothetical protein
MKATEEYVRFDNTVRYAYNESVIAEIAIQLHLGQSIDKQTPNPYYVETATSFLHLRKIIMQLHESVFCTFKSLELRDSVELREKINKETSDIIIYSQILLDTFVCLVKTIMTGDPFIKIENKMYADLSNSGLDKVLRKTFKKLCKESWCKYISNLRHMIVHKGYLIEFFRGRDGCRLDIGKRDVMHLTKDVKGTRFRLSIQTFRNREKNTNFKTIDIDRIADGIFNQLPEFENKLDEKIRATLNLDLSNTKKYEFKELKKVRLMGCAT